MDAECTFFLGRRHYQQVKKDGQRNHRKDRTLGLYDQGVWAGLNWPSPTIAWSTMRRRCPSAIKWYDVKIEEELWFMLLSEVSTRTLELLA